MANDAAAVSGASDAINNAIQIGATNLGQAQTDLGQNALPKASSALDSFAAVSGDLTGIVSGLTLLLQVRAVHFRNSSYARSGQDHAVPDRCLACQGPGQARNRRQRHRGATDLRVHGRAGRPDGRRRR